MSARYELKDSERPLPDDAEDHGPVPADDRVEVTVYLRSDPSGEHLGPAADADLAAVRSFASEHGLEILRTNPAARSVKLGGSASAVAQAFGVALHTYVHGGVAHRGHPGRVSLPVELEPAVEAVFGLDNRPLGRNFMRHAPEALQAAIQTANAAATQAADTYLPPQVAALYDFPSQTAAGQTVAVFAFNGPSGAGSESSPGGYDPTVLDRYFSTQLKLPAPQITDVTVQGPGNDPGDGSNPDDASPEIYLDLSIVGSLATEAKIVIYFTEFTEQGWVDALTEATTDTAHDPSVISISYGNPEKAKDSAWSAAAVKQVNLAFEAATMTRGRTIVCAAGDSGASDGESTGVHVDFPASSPWVLACGGTRLDASGGHLSSEVVWNDQTPDASTSHGATGGGVSVLFALPTWQDDAAVPVLAGGTKHGRGVPDVSSLADPETPFIVAQPGGIGGVGGTSAAAPLWASLIARCNAGRSQPVGFVNPKLYAMPSGTLRDITSGNNKMPPNGPGYDSGPGWDACTGLGSPGGSSLFRALDG